MTQACISALAAGLAQRYAARDPFAICEGEGITVLLREDFKTQKGAFASVCGQPFVFVSGTLSGPMRRMVCAHELGHALLHAREGGFFADFALPGGTGRREREANLFAAELLLEDGEVLSMAMEGADAVQIARRAGVHVDFVLLKAMAMNRRGCVFRLPRTPDSRFLGHIPDDAGAL